jgi:hypothetical protein
MTVISEIKNSVDGLKKLDVKVQYSIISILSTMPFWFVALFLMKKVFFNSNPIYISIIFSFCFEAIFFFLYIYIVEVFYLVDKTKHLKSEQKKITDSGITFSDIKNKLNEYATLLKKEITNDKKEEIKAGMNSIRNILMKIKDKRQPYKKEHESSTYVMATLFQIIVLSLNITISHFFNSTTFISFLIILFFGSFLLLFLGLIQAFYYSWKLEEMKGNEADSTFSEIIILLNQLKEAGLLTSNPESEL